MATFHIPISCDVTAGSTNFKVKYRLKGDSVWTSFLIYPPPTSGTTATVPWDSPVNVLLDNRIYDFQIQNINGVDNPVSVIAQDIGITDPGPAIFPTSTGVGYSFENLSEDVDQYTCTIVLFSSPGTIIQTHILDATSGIISDSFSNLDSLTSYILSITPVASQFSKTFTYPFDTTAISTCPDVADVTATIISS